jgi:hypothetical protein
MSIINVGDAEINENQVDGTELARRLERLYSAFHSQNSNATRPPYVTAGGLWSKTVTGGFDLMIFDGTTDYKIGSVGNGSASFGGFESGTKLLFQQTAAPIGWTKDITQDNKALRVVSGAVTTGGSVPFTTAFASQAANGTVTGHALTIAEMPSHTHIITDPGHSHGVSDPGHAHSMDAYVQYGNPGSNTIPAGVSQPVGYGTFSAVTNISIAGSSTNVTAQTSGSGSAHTHGFTGTAINLAVQYVDTIIATKD